MANTNAPYGFRLWGRLVPGTGSIAVGPGSPAGATASSSGPLTVGSATTLKVGDPIKASLGIGYLAAGTQAIFGICNSPVPGWGETATQKHYPEILPCDDQTIWRCQSIGTVNATAGYCGMAKKYKIGGTTSGYTGINLATAGTGALSPIALAPGSAYGTFAELLVMVVRGQFYGAA